MGEIDNLAKSAQKTIGELLKPAPIGVMLSTAYGTKVQGFFSFLGGLPSGLGVPLGITGAGFAIYNGLDSKKIQDVGNFVEFAGMAVGIGVVVLGVEIVGSLAMPALGFGTVVGFLTRGATAIAIGSVVKLVRDKLGK